MPRTYKQLRLRGHNLRDTGGIMTTDECLSNDKYGKMATREICHRCYHPRCSGLNKKILLARDCVKSHSGWGRSNTVLNH